MAARVEDHRRVLLERVPLIDLRAPAEYATGAFPQSINLPLLTDAERAAVGTRYKTHGQRAAIVLGESLVSGATRRARIDAWRTFVATHPRAMLYCWRGGLRSQIAQQWLHEAGVDVPRIEGGYKALRRTCLEAVEEFCASPRLLVLGGRTGSGKTDLLHQFAHSIDLEALANHRGSAFGATFTPQPPPIAFENALAIEMLRQMPNATVLVEDESRTIGRLALPESLHHAIQRAPIVVLDVERSERAARIQREYVAEPLAKGVRASDLKERYVGAVDRIRRRLGGVRHAQIRDLIEDAFNGEPAAPERHLLWIDRLLEWYYDPMYDHQLTGKQSRVVAKGDRGCIAGYLRTALAQSADVDTAAVRDEPVRLQP